MVKNRRDIIIEKAEKIIVKPAHDKLDQVANETAEAFIEAYKECQDIIRNHMNDGWIPVERELPPNAKHKGSFCPKVRVMTKFGETYGWYNPDRESWYVLAWFMTDRYLESEIDFDKGDNPKIVFLTDEVNSKRNILTAWKEMELYRPERSDNHDGE